VPSEHPGDALGQDLGRWIEETAQHLADRFTGSPYTPPSAPLTQAEKVRYFANMIWTPDGEPNLPGRDALEKKYGWKGFAGILTHLSKAHGRMHADLADQDALPEPGG